MEGEMNEVRRVENRRGRVLIVEADQHARQTLSGVLRTAGYETVETERGEQAIHTLNSADNALMVDAILCDVGGSHVDGPEAIQYFRSQFPGVSIVAMTGAPDTKSAVALMQQGVHDYLVKPVSDERMLNVMGKAVRAHDIFGGATI